MQVFNDVCDIRAGLSVISTRASQLTDSESVSQKFYHIPQKNLRVIIALGFYSNLECRLFPEGCEHS